jgi:hypothetical protein
VTAPATRSRTGSQNSPRKVVRMQPSNSLRLVQADDDGTVTLNLSPCSSWTAGTTRPASTARIRQSSTVLGFHRNHSPPARYN